MKRFIVFLSIFLLISAAVFGQIDLQPLAVIRLSKTEQISVKQFKDYVNWLTITKIMSTGDINARLTNDERRLALDELGNQFLACQAAEQEKITVTSREIDQYFDQSMKNFSESLAQVLGHTPTEAEVDAELRNRTGMTRAGFKDIMKRSLITENYLKIKKKALFESIKQPTDAEIQVIYNDFKGKSTLEGGFSRPDTIGVRMIIVPIINSNGRTAAQTTANNLAKQIGNDPGRFDEVARDFQKPNSGYVTGNGYMYKHERIRESIGAAFFDAAFSLKQGEVSKLLERPDGFYLIKVIETYRARILALDDIYSLEDPRNITIKQAIIAMEMQRRLMAALQQASEELVAELRKKGTIEIKMDIYNQITW
ncbi:MAG: peptidylprolyl isomerase [Spirochaetaceae bacterium]|jgi:parvulin-like peptidyl-prolyl isomerase|nr:peptidylprolyl isomerase [Spirochaetaceae bacterium]